MRIVKTLLPAILVASLLSSLSIAAARPDRILGPIDPTAVVTLTGHVSPMARPESDQGPVEPSRMLRVNMFFSPSAQQQQALLKLLADQQDSSSPNFHQWLTADQFGARFGLSDGDIAKISVWLQAQGLKVTYVAHGRDFLSFEGSAAQVESALRTQIHSYNVNGKAHFANVTAPSIPAALGGIVSGFLGLHNFFPRPMLKQHPDYTASSTFHALAPGDLATIYHINPLYQQNPAIDGTGQKVAIMAQTDVYIADLNDYRTAFGLSAISGCTMDGTNTIIKAGACTSGNFQMVVSGTNGTNNDPGVKGGDLGESDLDIETISAVARNAQIIFVTSALGVDDSAAWAIDNQLAPVMSYSYGLCEAFVTAPNVTPFETEFQKADSLGISFFAASGDAASATCDGDVGNYPAILGPSVSYPASSAYVTGVGGTEFNEGSGTYWNSSNGTDGGSAKSYIPEIGWNDTLLSVQNGNGLDGSGGGPSNCAFGTGTTNVGGFLFEVCNAPPNGGFPKPTWQSGVTPNDSVRDVPDISFSASNANDPYIVCTAQSEVPKGSNSSTSTCVSGIQSALTQFNSAFGGTSASTPVAAGMAVLLNQYLGANGLGLLNPQLYKLYGTNLSAFHDITAGSNSTTGGTSDNIVACTGGAPSFEPTALRCPTSGVNAGLIGFSAGTGYDLVTGLGTIDFNALFTAWPTSRTTATTTSISPSTTKINPGQSVTFTATVTPSTAVGSVSFSNNNNGTITTLGTALISALNAGVATFSTTSLPAGSNSVTAAYLGDASRSASSSAPAVVTVSDFALSSNPTAVTVVAGHTSSNITVTVTPQNGYAQATTLSCTGLPAGSSCSFTPGSVTPNGVTPATSTMTVLTNANMGAVNGASFMISATNGGSLTHTSSFSLTTTATDQSFTLAPGAASYQVTQGSTVNNATVTLTGTNGFNTTNSPVTYTCTDPASESTCTVSATTATTATFNITTTAQTGSLRKPLDRGRGIFYAALLPGILGILFTAGSRRRSLRGMRLLGLIVALGLSTLWMGACSNSSGGGGNPGTPKGTYTININATTGGANALTASTSFQLVVQ